MAMFGFPHWQLKSTSTGEAALVAPDERCRFAQTAIMGVQHAVAMFRRDGVNADSYGAGSNLSILMSGVGTLLFFFITGGRVPSYLGSSAAFVGVVIAATGFNGQALTRISALRWAGLSPVGWLYRHWPGGDENRYTLD